MRGVVNLRDRKAGSGMQAGRVASIGDPPSHLSEVECGYWREVQGTMGWLDMSHRGPVEMLCRNQATHAIASRALIELEEKLIEYLQSEEPDSDDGGSRPRALVDKRSKQIVERDGEPNVTKTLISSDGTYYEKKIAAQTRLIQISGRHIIQCLRLLQADKPSGWTDGTNENDEMFT